MALLADFVVETANSPGTSTTVNLAGAAGASFNTWASRFTNGTQVFYTISDEASMRETGIGTFATGAPATITRTTVLANTLGTNARLNFVGPCLVYNEIPASKQVYFDAAGNIATITTLTISGTMTATNLVATGINAAGISVSGTTTSSTVASNIMTQAGASGWSNFYRASSGLPAILLTQTPSGPDATGLVCNLRAASSFYGVWQLNGATVGSIGTNGTNAQYFTTSDYRLKLTFGPAETGGIIDAVPVHDVAFIAKPQDHAPRFLAHELQAACPWAVSGEKDALDVLGNMIPQVVDHSSLVPTLWNEVQALRRRVAELESKK